MRTTIIRTLQGENGNIFKISQGRRIKAASCDMDIEIREIDTTPPRTKGVKRYRIVLIFANNINTLTDPDEIVNKHIEIEADIQRQDGLYERFYFDDLCFEEYDTLGEWQFETDNQDIIRKLMEI